MQLVASVLVALAAACTFAVSAVLQQRAAREVAAPESLSFHIFSDLLRRPSWLAGTASLILGYLLQALALALGDVSLVAPIIVTELIFAVPLAARSEHRRPGPREWVGACGVVIGVGTFLAAADPHGGHPQPAMVVWVLMLASCAAVVACALSLTVRSRTAPDPVADPQDGTAPPGTDPGPEDTHDDGDARRAALLAVAAGVTFGLLAVLTKNVAYQVGRHGPRVLLAWELYALIGVGICGFLFSQSAYQASSLRDSLPVIDAVEPTVAVLAAAAAFGEHLAHDPASLALEVLGAATAFGGVFLVGRSPLVLSLYQAGRVTS